MQVSNVSQQMYSASAYKKQDHAKIQQDKTGTGPQTAEVISSTVSAEIRSGYDLTRMTSQDMLALANSFHKEGNIRDFLTLAVFSARAALEDHPDPAVRHTWVTPRNKDGTFNLLAEIQAPKPYSTGSPEFDKKQQENHQHLLDTLLALPAGITKIERSTIGIKGYF